MENEEINFESATELGVEKPTSKGNNIVLFFLVSSSICGPYYVDVVARHGVSSSSLSALFPFGNHVPVAVSVPMSH